MSLFRLFFMAALSFTAPAMAQEMPAHRQVPALDPGNTKGLEPVEIACKVTNADGESKEIASMKWNGGAISTDICPPGAALVKYYAAEIVTGMGPSQPLPETKAGGVD